MKGAGICIFSLLFFLPHKVFVVSLEVELAILWEKFLGTMMLVAGESMMRV